MVCLHILHCIVGVLIAIVSDAVLAAQDKINNFRDTDKEKKKEKNDPRGMRHFDFDQAPRTVKLDHVEKIGWQTIEDINEYSLYILKSFL